MLREKRFQKILLMALILIACLGEVKAIAVSGPYYENRALELGNGESKEFKLVLQNMDGDADIKVRAEVVNGGEFVRIIDTATEYIIPVKSNNVSVNMRAEIPVNADFKEQDVRIKFEPVNTGGEGMVQVVVGLSWDFKLKRIESKEDKMGLEETKSYQQILILLIAPIIFLIIILLIVVWRKGFFNSRKTKK